MTFGLSRTAAVGGQRHAVFSLSGSGNIIPAVPGARIILSGGVLSVADDAAVNTAELTSNGVVMLEDFSLSSLTGPMVLGDEGFGWGVSELDHGIDLNVVAGGGTWTGVLLYFIEPRPTYQMNVNG